MSFDRRSLITGLTPVRKLNSALYYARRHKWRYHPRFRDDPAIAIDRPVFLIGIQGGGLTILSRILHRLPETVSAAGDHMAWASDDECQNVYRDILPEELSWRDVSVEGFSFRNFALNGHNWVFASEPYREFYLRGAEHATPELAAEFQSVIRRILRLHGATPAKPKRFIDKSQSLATRVGLVTELLSGCGPRFVLFVRNPFAAVWRAATGDDVIASLDMPIERKVEVAAQHWKGLYESALAHDGRQLGVWKFEDFLAEPERIVREVCDHAALEFSPAIMPGPNDTIPWGSMYDAFNLRKWHPFRTDVNDRYLAEIPDWARDLVRRECGALVDRFQY